MRILQGYYQGRENFLSLLIITSIIIFYFSNRLVSALISIIGAAIVLLIFINLVRYNYIEAQYIVHIETGFKTLVSLTQIDHSVWERLEVWSASKKAILNNPLFGYGVTERFNALKPYLNENVQSFTHPHNDIIAGIISAGLLGGFTALFSLISVFLAAILTPKKSLDKFFLASIISIHTLITANVSTVFFNDITSAWFAFSIYLIWNVNYKSYDITNER